MPIGSRGNETLVIEWLRIKRTSFLRNSKCCKMPFSLKVLDQSRVMTSFVKSFSKGNAATTSGAEKGKRNGIRKYVGTH